MGLLVAAALVLIALWRGDVIRPGSFARRKPKRDVEGLPTAVWFGCALMLFISQFFSATLMAGVLKSAGVAADSIKYLSLSNLGMYALCIATGAFLIYLVEPRSRGAGLVVRGGDFLRGLGLLILIYPVTFAVSRLGVIVYELLMRRTPDPVAHETLRTILENRSNPWIWLVYVSVTVGAPIVEELIFRVFLQSALLRAFRSHWWAILIQATVFAAIHYPGVPWHALPILFTLGVALGTAYERTGRLGVPITMHAAYNGSSLLLALMTQ